MKNNPNNVPTVLPGNGLCVCHDREMGMKTVCLGLKKAYGKVTLRREGRQIRYAMELGFNISVQSDSNRLTIHFGGGNNIPMRARNDEGLTG